MRLYAAGTMKMKPVSGRARAVLPRNTQRNGPGYLSQIASGNTAHLISGDGILGLAIGFGRILAFSLFLRL
jgi:hypothetical protein